MINDEWKVKTATFQGYMKKSIENIEHKLDKHDRHHEKIYKKLEIHSNAIERLKVKAAIAGTMAATLVTGFWMFITLCL